MSNSFKHKNYSVEKIRPNKQELVEMNRTANYWSLELQSTGLDDASFYTL